MIAIYIPTWDAPSIELFLACRPESYGGTLMICQSVEELRRNLIQVAQELIVTVLIIDNFEGLQSLSSMREYLVDIKTIFVMPDNKSEMLSLGYSFFPTYITVANGHVKNLEEVVSRMVQKAQDRSHSEKL